MKGNSLISKRIIELSRKAYEKNIVTFTNFLSIDELEDFYSIKKELSTNYYLTGGVDDAERKLIIFGDYEEINYYSPIRCLEIKAKDEKFADNFSHRDFLGALMNLGVERDNFGDIFVKGNRGYVLCLDKISDFIINNLHKVKRTFVTCKILDEIPTFLRLNLKMLEVNSASERIDCIISATYNLSRNNANLMFKEKNVYVNDRLKENNSYFLKEDDIVSVRGLGRFVFKSKLRDTKKGKGIYLIEKYS